VDLTLSHLLHNERRQFVVESWTHSIASPSHYIEQTYNKVSSTPTNSLMIEALIQLPSPCELSHWFPHLQQDRNASRTLGCFLAFVSLLILLIVVQSNQCSGPNVALLKTCTVPDPLADFFTNRYFRCLEVRIFIFNFSCRPLTLRRRRRRRRKKKQQQPCNRTWGSSGSCRSGRCCAGSTWQQVLGCRTCCLLCRTERSRC